MTTTPTSGAADRAIEGCPELNMGNYDEVDVERLNDWAIRAHDEIDRLHALAAGQATAAPAQPAAQQGVAWGHSVLGHARCSVRASLAWASAAAATSAYRAAHAPSSSAAVSAATAEAGWARPWRLERKA